MLAVFLLASLVPAQAGATGSVQGSMSAHNELFRRCFEHSQVKSGSARLRFRVSPEGRAESATLEALAPESPELSACLLRALSMVSFEAEAAGADVVYPIQLDAAEDEPAPSSAPKRSPARLSIASRDALFLVDDWLVVDQHGAGVSDLDLARISGETALHADLRSTQSRLYTYSAVEGLVAAAGLVVAGFGLVRALDDPQRDSHSVDVGLAAGGGALSLTAGGLCIYHLIRALDLGAARPTWHHLELDEAERLVGRANGG
ncbi:MAG: hypothetical protein IT384_21900 [Deltaproteobacteria bacterium]|nr:hypothetical protein [Deltaproteobacteria bacterium]